MRKEITTEKYSVRYRFTADELRALGKTLAEQQIRLRQIEDDFKAVRDEWKSRIAAMESQITSLSNKVNDGYEYRDVECLVRLDQPPGFKTVINPYTSEPDRVLPMTNEDRSPLLPFEDNPKENEDEGSGPS